MQILLAYDHWDNTKMIIEGCYQFLMSISFILRQLHEFWNQDKVCFENQKYVILFFFYLRLP